MKSLHAPARIGAVLLAVGLLSGYVYVRAGGTLWNRAPAAASPKHTSNLVAADGTDRLPGSVPVVTTNSDAELPLVPVASDRSKEGKAIVLPGSKNWNGATEVLAGALIANDSDRQPAPAARPAVMPSSKFIPLSTEVVNRVFGSEPAAAAQPTSPLPTTSQQPPPAIAAEPAADEPFPNNKFVEPLPAFSPRDRQQAGGKKHSAAKPPAPAPQIVLADSSQDMGDNTSESPTTGVAKDDAAQAKPEAVLPGSKAALVISPVQEKEEAAAAVAKQQPPDELPIRIDGPKKLQAGQSAIFTLTIANRGKTALSRVIVSRFQFEAGLKPTLASAGYKIQGGALSWELGKVEPGQVERLQVKAEAQGEATRVCTRAVVSAGGLTRVADACVNIQAVAATSATSPVEESQVPAQDVKSKNQQPSKPGKKIMGGSKSGFFITPGELGDSDQRD